MVNLTDVDKLSYYSSYGPMTDPGEFAELFEALPSDVPGLCKAVQGLMIHIYWAQQYGVNLTDEQRQAVQVRPVARKLALIRELDSRPLTESRPPEKRLVGNCRDFSTLLSAMLRYKGIPARARCGFATYFMPNHYEDHWVVEYWKADEERWVMVDSQLDDLQQEKLSIQFNTLDMPPWQFWTGGMAWQVCRAGKANPDDFGIFEYKGMGFIRGNLIRDILSLNKLELLPWDLWGLTLTPDDELTPADLSLLDRMAELTQVGVEPYPEALRLYEENPVLHMPAEWAK